MSSYLSQSRTRQFEKQYCEATRNPIVSARRIPHMLFDSDSDGHRHLKPIIRIYSIKQFTFTGNMFSATHGQDQDEDQTELR